MTDEELIKMLREKGPEEMTVEELDALRRRLRESPELRRALRQFVNLEESLNELLGSVRISVDGIIEECAAKRPRPRFARAGWRVEAILAVSIMIVVCLTVLVIGNLGRRGDTGPSADQPAETAGAEETAKVEEVPLPAVPEVVANPPAEAGSAGDVRPSGPAESGAAQAVIEKTPPKEPESSSLDAVPREPGGETSFLEACFEDFEVDESFPNQTEVERWLAPVEGRTTTFEQRDIQGIKVVGFDGLLGWKTPWRPGSVLRLSLLDRRGFKLHFFSDSDGASLWFSSRTRRWTAYRASRQGPQITRGALVACDEGMYARSGNGTMEVRHQDGQLILSRGDWMLLAAPLPSPPSEILFEGHALVRGMRLDVGEPFPVRRVARGEPIEAEWRSVLPQGASTAKVDEGGIDLVTETTEKTAAVGKPIPLGRFHEILFELEDASPGSGIFLRGAAGILCRVGFFRAVPGGETILGFLGPDDERTELPVQRGEERVPLAGKRQWLKLLSSCGTVKCWTSGDGVHWSRALDSVTFQGLPSEAGIYCLKGAARRVRLRGLQARAADETLLSVVPEGILETITLPDEVGSLSPEKWLSAVGGSRPAGDDPRARRLGWTWRTLIDGCSPALGNFLLCELLRSGFEKTESSEDRIRLVEEAALLASDLDPGLFRRFAERTAMECRWLGIKERAPQPFTSMWPALGGIVLRTEPGIADPLVRQEVLELLHARRWEELQVLVQRLAFWMRTGDPATPSSSFLAEETKPLLAWAGAQARRNLQRQGDGGSPIVTTGTSHPWIEDLSKEGYNLLAEFEAAIAGEQLKDACEIISSAMLPGTVGLSPDSKDRNLFVSLPSAVALALKENRRFAETMRNEFGVLGRLRVNAAIEEGSLAAIEAATLQFLGTEAAAEAHLWLGDRELSGGDFVRALAQYRQALPSSSPAQSEKATARMRLAAAFLGREEGKPAALPLELGEVRLGPKEFEDLLRDVRGRSPGSSIPLLSDETPVRSADDLAPQGPCEARVLAKLADSTNQQPKGVPPQKVDGPARSLSASAARETLYVSNRFQVAAFDLESGKGAWAERASVGGDRSARWALVAMRPLVRDSRVFVRRCTGEGPELLSIDASTGQIAWRARPGNHVASDPIAAKGDLLAFTVNATDSQTLELTLTSFEPASGKVLAQRSMARFRDVWEREIPCQAALLEDGIVASAGGVVFSCDLLGQSRWLRRQTLLTALQDPEWFTMHHAPPIVGDGRVFVSQPGVRALECLDARSGKLIWRMVAHDLRKILGLSGGRLMVLAGESVIALGAEAGAVLWRSDLPGLIDAQVDSGGKLLCLETGVSGPGPARPSLVLIDPAKGSEGKSFPIQGLEGEDLALGPLVLSGGRTLIFVGRKGSQEREREIVEIRPSAAPSAASPEPPR